MILAPHVSEHRCDPPESGVTAVPGTITVSVSGSATSEREVADAIQRGLTSASNARARWGMPGSAA